MILLGNLMLGVASVLGTVLTVINFIIIISVIFSWLQLGSGHPVVRFIDGVAEGVYQFVRRYIKKTVFGSLDFAPLIALLGLVFLQTVLVGSLREYGFLIKTAGF